MTREHLKITYDVWGEDKNFLEGKVTHKKLPHMKSARPYVVPQEIMKRHRNITLCMNVMYVNDLMYLVGVSHNIKYGAASYIEDQQHNSIINAMKKQCSEYTRRDFNATKVYMDAEFADLEEAVNAAGEDIAVSTNSKEYKKNAVHATITSSGKGKKVPELERLIRTIKEGVQVTKAGLANGIRALPRILIVEMVGLVLLFTTY